ncbi:septum formation initiator family protein [Nocardioides sp. zg-ZUI104]|uniref:FtsB family cell division protein n=1 Tax=Nocardioides faecalis TaxID=2803858 RepID=UPI001BCEB81C|nr:septum formation initiator family protein [Nocardioides faecalis]MBS4752624.1 septum formation initiator family protein [Nocardioides faecalis]
MAATPGERRTSRKPGRPTTGRSGPRYAERKQAERKQAARERQAALDRARAEHRRRSRLTGRAAILVLVLAVLAVSYASSLRAYLQQRSEIEDLQAQIAQRKASIEELEQEKERWEDPSFVAQQARARFGYVAKGETPYVVVDDDGEPLDASAELGDPDDLADPDKRVWYEDAWDSMKIAGNPPRKVPAPKDTIRAPKADLEEKSKQ